MSKAILELNKMPNLCEECLFYKITGICDILSSKNHYMPVYTPKNSRHPDCPLKEINCLTAGFTVIDNTTGEYPDTEKIALTEDWANKLIYCDIYGFALLEDGHMLLVDDCGNAVHCPPDRFKVIPIQSTIDLEKR